MINIHERGSWPEELSDAHLDQLTKELHEGQQIKTLGATWSTLSFTWLANLLATTNFSDERFFTSNIITIGTAATITAFGITCYTSGLDLIHKVQEAARQYGGDVFRTGIFSLAVDAPPPAENHAI